MSLNENDTNWYDLMEDRGSRSVGRPVARWEDNINRWFDLVQGRDA